MIEDYTMEEPLIILVGNKSDLMDSRIITTKQHRALAQSLGFKYFETSARDDINVKETFDYIVDAILAKRTHNSPQTTPRTTPEPTPKAHSKCAC